MTRQQKTLFALLLPTLLGVFYIAENTLAVGNLQKVPTAATSTYSLGAFCMFRPGYPTYDPYDTTGDYPRISSPAIDFALHHKTDACGNPEPYQIPIPTPAAPDYWEYNLYVISNDTDMFGASSVTTYWADHTGTQYATSAIPTIEDYSFGGENYKLVRLNTRLYDTENQGYLKYMVGPYYAHKIYALLYTSEDLLGEINSATDLQNFMDAGMALEAEPDATSTRITELITPIQGGLEPNTTVTFNFKIWYNTGTGEPTYDIFGINIENLVDGITYIPIEDFISASGINTFNENKVLTAGKLYRWRAYIRDSDEVNPTIWSNWVEFDVVDRSGFTTSYPGSYDLVATSSSSTQINVYGGSIVSFLDGVAAYLLTFRSKFDANDATATAARLASSTGAVFSYAGAVFSLMDPSNSTGLAAILMTLVLVGFFLTILVRLLKLILRR